MEGNLKHPKADCTNCPLLEKGKFVSSSFPVSDQNNRIAFVGESPGRSEVIKQQVFIGPSGQVLNAVMKEHGINRRGCLMTNAIACHYSQRDFEKPPEEAVIACRPRLISELEEAGIDTAITVGAVAATALIDTKVGITRLRGGAPKSSSYWNGKVIPTFHPAAALRDQTKFPYIVRDIAKIKPGGPWEYWKDPDYLVIKYAAPATKWLNYLAIEEREFGPVDIDTESGADKDEDFGGAIKEVLCIGIKFHSLGRVVVFTPDAMSWFNRRFLGQILVSRGIAAQNGKYDTVRCLNTYLGDENSPLDIPVVEDTMLASYALDEGKGVHGLDYMGQEYLGAPDWKHWIDESIARTKARIKAERKAAKLPLRGIFAEGKDFSLVEPDVLYKYNAYDVHVQSELRKKFSEELVAGQVDGLYRWLIRVSNMLGHVETNGLCVDLDYNLQLEKEYQEMLEGIEFARGAEDINPRSWQQVQKFLSTMGVKVDSTNKQTLQGLIGRYSILGRDDIVDFCKSLLEHRGASKLMGTYVTGLRKNLINGVAHPTFLLHGTATGRPSCRNPNLSNIPRPCGIRRQFVPSRSNRVFVSADYAQAEFRVLCWMAKDELVRQMFERAYLDPDPKNDVFINLCTEMYGDKFSLASKEVRKEMRTMIKTMAYGIMYGREVKAIASAFEISFREAERQMKTFTAMIPGIMGFMQSVKDRVMAGEDLVNPFGRRRRFHLITNMNKVNVFNEAMASLPQGTASDICLEAACRLDEQGLQIRNLVYDNIMVECDKNEVKEVSHLLQSVMVGTAEEVTEGYVRFAVDVETGTSWGDF